MSGSLDAVWELGYSIAELWGATKPVTRGTSAVDTHYPILWGILAIAEYQIDRGAGHNYLRSRLMTGDWIAIGYTDDCSAEPTLVKLRPIPDAKFGKKRSAIGDGTTNFRDVRIVNSELLEIAAA
jgi:hypothetical protein